MPVKLTQKVIAALVCPAGKRDAMVFDSETTGLAVRVTRQGGKHFLVQYSLASLTRRRVRLAKFGSVTLEQARAAARDVLGAVAHGRDPYAERAAEAAAVRKAAAAETLGDLIDAWARARKGDRRPSYLGEAAAGLRGYTTDWQRRAAGSITAGEIRRRLTEIKAGSGPYAANRTASYGQAVYAWAVLRTQRLADNPFKAHERWREPTRERVLDLAEVGGG